ncbi:MAG: trypsin-like serine protease [Phycicoccus sp.]|nr:trypsin-like serine protease [Phycicoccus sp.]NMM35541.1 trypsin-like serine protease [Phycicoccus sp.]
MFLLLRRHARVSRRRHTPVVALLTALLVMVGLGAGPASAITYGELDNAGHPAVVLVLMEVDGQPAYRCSGTLISSTVVLTAGHCTGEPGEFSGMRVFNESDVQTDTYYPFGGGPNSVEATGWYTYPGFTGAEFYLNDVGVIQLAKPINLQADEYGQLPTANQLDSLKPRASTTFTSVGYGLQRVNNNPNNLQLESNKVRMLAHPYLVQINTGFTGPQSLVLSNNAATGGTCFGDSGGPNFVGTSMVIAGVTSFGLNGSCGGTGGVFRVDRPAVLAFINQHMS